MRITLTLDLDTYTRLQETASRHLRSTKQEALYLLARSLGTLPTETEPQAEAPPTPTGAGLREREEGCRDG